MEEVILVNELDEQVGTMEKMEAHVKGELHRAFSIFLFNNKNEMLLQQRAFTKYHSAGLRLIPLLIASYVSILNC